MKESRVMTVACKVALIAMAGTLAASPVSAKTATRVVGCGAQSCLKLSGQRADAAEAITLNGHEISVQGGRNWQARVPVRTVREWSAPYARSIEVGIAGRPRDVALPIGLLGQPLDLAMLVVRVK
ncbi:MAG: hypothetical protein VW935_08380 [Novosphingobium sp.]